MTDARSAASDPGAPGERAPADAGRVVPGDGADAGRVVPGDGADARRVFPRERGDAPRVPPGGGVDPRAGAQRREDAGRHRGAGPGPVLAFFRANPQVLILVVICLVLGLGTFLAVLFGLVSAGSDQTTGEPSGAILGSHLGLASSAWLAP